MFKTGEVIRQVRWGFCVWWERVRTTVWGYVGSRFGGTLGVGLGVRWELVWGWYKVGYENFAETWKFH
jgi:hypothetical protein